MQGNRVCRVLAAWLAHFGNRSEGVLFPNRLQVCRREAVLVTFCACGKVRDLVYSLFSSLLWLM